MSTAAELRKELEAAKAAAESAEAKRLEATELADLKAQIELEKRRAEESIKLYELEAQYGTEGRFIRRIDSPDGMVVVKRPAHVAYKQFVDNGKFTLDACNKLVLCCLVYPSKEAYTDLTDKSPAVVTAAANEIVKLAGFKAEDNSGK